MATRKPKVGGARPGAGRPALFRERRSLTLNVEAGEYAALEALAAVGDRTVSEVVRDAIRAFLRGRRTQR